MNFDLANNLLSLSRFNYDQSLLTTFLEFFKRLSTGRQTKGTLGWHNHVFELKIRVSSFI